MKDRIKEILDSQGLNATQFAQKVSMNVSALSHILSGRNNPGYDALQKIIVNFPQISVEWLMTGQGEMYKEILSDEPEQVSLFDENPLKADPGPGKGEYPAQKGLKSPQKPIKYTDNQQLITKEKAGVKIRKIAVFYSDNTYEEFFPQ
ncbi:MAG: helix-turn-helix transcriptional regulator [Bacteroidales bacterium]|nr:helix-turn-helix transcriptional regulator [Bacteroidales bacterium]MDD3430458.1 helix-turn-helix transcriptional regulator [Bacteroidales bacterium]MDD4361696.1 helix-turn-helix transcriptional regulator [Bacteroidales bacterium]